MKKLLLVFAVMALGFAASAQKMATATSQAISSGKTSGTYVLQLPNEITTADVDVAKAYYVSYFGVAFNATTHQATITLTQNQELNKKIITRFLVSLKVDTVKVDDKTCASSEFYETYLK